MSNINTANPGPQDPLRPHVLKAKMIRRVHNIPTEEFVKLTGFTFKIGADGAIMLETRSYKSNEHT